MVVLLISSSQYVFGAWFASIQSGAWDNSDVWPSWHNGATPVSGDGVSIGAGHIVTYNGNLNFNSGQIQLNGGRLNINGDLTIGSGVTFGSTSLGGTLFVNGDLILNSDFPIDGPLNVIVTGDVVAYSNIYFNPGNSIFVVQGDFTHHATLNAHNNGQLIVQGDYTTEGGGSTEIASGGDIYTFGSTTCSGSGCPSIQDQSDWDSLPNPPGEQYVSSGEIQLYSSGTFTVPAGVTTVKVEAWGAGADGGTGGSGGDGGGGGAYASSVITGLTSGSTHTVTVGSSGGNSSFDDDSFDDFVVADGANGQTGGQANASTGDVVNSGGDGGNPDGNNGGGGGGSAWSYAPGNPGEDAGSNTGGTGGPGEGNGGDGGLNGNDGNNGNTPGGGGGGAGKGKNTTGGSGADGQVIVSWSNLPFVYFSQPSSSIIESDNTVYINVKISEAPASNITIPFIVSGTATLNNDFSISSNSVTFNSGQTNTTIAVTIIDDTEEDESGETIILTLQNSAHATLTSPSSHTLTIIENDFSDPTLTAEDDTVCVNDTITLTASIDKCDKDIYDYFLSTDGGISFINITNKIIDNCTATYKPSSQGTYAFYYTHKNGESNVVGVTVLGVPPQPGTISGNTTLCPGTTGETYSIDPVPGATNYIWSVPTGWDITEEHGTTEITVSTGTSGGTISVVAENDCGASDSSILPVVIEPLSASAKQVTADYECPQLISDYGFNPNNDGPYNPGSSEIMFAVILDEPASEWDFSFDIEAKYDETSVVIDSVNILGTHYDLTGTSPYSYTDVPQEADSVGVHVWVKNIPGEQVKVIFDVSEISDDNCTSTFNAEKRDTVIMNIMPVVGRFE